MVPPHVRTLARAATCPDCSPALRAAASVMIGTHAVSVEPVARVRAAAASSPLGSDQAACAREIRSLRDVLPRDCEMRMLGSREAYEQATRAIREGVLASKFEAAAGRRGANCARGRRAITRYLSFCRKAGVARPWPVYSPTFLAFIQDAFSASKGAKGGGTVKHGLKVAFIHLRDHFGLHAELDAPVLFNMAKAYRGDSDSATSPSIWCACEWERLASAHESEVGRLVCRMAVLALWLSLRAVHFVGATVLDDANDDDIRINLASDKDGSSNIWAGCDAVG